MKINGNQQNQYKLIDDQQLKVFDVSNQYKNSYEDWCAAFSKAIKKRTNNTEQKIFLGLSSGYDSGGYDSDYS